MSSVDCLKVVELGKLCVTIERVSGVISSFWCKMWNLKEGSLISSIWSEPAFRGQHKDHWVRWGDGVSVGKPIGRWTLLLALLNTMTTSPANLSHILIQSGIWSDPTHKPLTKHPAPSSSSSSIYSWDWVCQSRALSVLRDTSSPPHSLFAQGWLGHFWLRRLLPQRQTVFSLVGGQ